MTVIACPFEQQLENIGDFGESSASRTLFDANGDPVATVEASCASWWLGTDAHGTTVIIDASTGEVRSHGKVHPGEPISDLPDRLTLPLSVR